MPTYAVTGATGQLGRLVVTELLTRGTPAADVVAIARTPARAADLAALGVAVREADYSVPATLPAALAGVDVLLLVSGSEVGQRVAQHAAVVDAAKAAGVGRIAYTSALRADTTQLSLAAEHRVTEDHIRASGVPFMFLRNGWYTENYTDQIGQYLAQGAITSATGDAGVAAATRADYAGATAAALTGDSPADAVYELGGTPFTMTDLAAAVSAATGTTVVHHDVSAEELIAVLRGGGLDEGTARFVADLDVATARGDLDTSSDDLVRLLGRPSTPLADAVRAAVDALPRT